jgi:hypothetical protein
MKAYAGIDLHASNNYIGVINDEDRRLYSKRVPNRLDAVLSAFKPFVDQLVGEPCPVAPGAPEQGTGPDGARRMSAGEPAPICRARRSAPRFAS